MDFAVELLSRPDVDFRLSVKFNTLVNNVELVGHVTTQLLLCSAKICKPYMLRLHVSKHQCGETAEALMNVVLC